MTKNRDDRIPTRAECEALMVAHAMQPHIIEHSFQVMKVSLTIVDNLPSEVPLNRELVLAGALLHDLTKIASLATNENHALSGGALLRELGFASTAEIVEGHIRIQNFQLAGRLEEREIVCYADKRVQHDRIVSIEARMTDIIERYGATEEIRRQILHNKEQALLIEHKIADCLIVDLQRAIREIAAP
jgi:uncharacterized protein